MISRDILARLVPPEAPDIELFPAVETVVAEDPVLRNLALWSRLVHDDLSRMFVGQAGRELDGALRAILAESDSVGVGIFYAPDEMPENSHFRVIEGYRFGLSVYHPQNLLRRDLPGPRRVNMRLSFKGYELPVVRFTSDFVAHFHPRHGRCSALVDIDGSSYLMTARHVVEHLRVGDSVDLVCKHGTSHPSTLIAKAPGYIDAALLEPDNPFTLCSARSTPTAIPVVHGLTVNGHFGSSTTPQSTTVMQDLRSGQGILSSVQPHIFLIDAMGRPGDSGSAISSTKRSDEVMAGMYLGETDIREKGVRKTVGYALETLQTLRIFKANLKGGLLL